jgi:hypothetical protein
MVRYQFRKSVRISLDVRSQQFGVCSVVTVGLPIDHCTTSTS